MYLPLAVPEGRYIQLPYWEKAAGDRYLEPPTPLTHQRITYSLPMEDRDAGRKGRN